MQRTDPTKLPARARVFGVLASSGPTSRAELARRTALAPSTVSAVIAELQDERLVVDGAAVPRGAVGRPAVLVALDRAAGVALGLDFGKRHLRVALADLAHNVLAERHQPLDADLPAAEAIARAVRLVGEVLAEAGARVEDIVGAGMGLPGPVHRPTGQLGDSTILPGWVGVRAADAMSEALGHPVEVENDASLGALGEWMWGAGRGAQDLAYLKLATGIGAGLIVRGRPYGGSGGTAGEIGHTIIAPDGPICRCGNRGCLETLAGSDAILGSLSGALEDPTLPAVIAAARDGHAGCARAIGDAGATIGSAVATLCNLLNPERVVVGGDLAAAGDLLLEPLSAALRRGAVRSAADDVTVLPAALGDRAEVLGAVGLVLRRGAGLLRV
jgi:predicted NBD/HSP70 family sugar kinase